MVECETFEAVKSRIYTGENETSIYLFICWRHGEKEGWEGVLLRSRIIRDPGSRPDSFIGNIYTFPSTWKALDLILPKERGSDQMTSLLLPSGPFQSVSFSSIKPHKWILSKVRLRYSDFWRVRILDLVISIKKPLWDLVFFFLWGPYPTPHSQTCTLSRSPRVGYGGLHSLFTVGFKAELQQLPSDPEGRYRLTTKSTHWKNRTLLTAIILCVPAFSCTDT